MSKPQESAVPDPVQWPDADTAATTIEPSSDTATLDELRDGAAAAGPTMAVGDSPISVGLAADADPAQVQVTVEDRSLAEDLGLQGVVFTLDGFVGGTVSVDYSMFADATGGGFGDRLRLVQLPACAVERPQDPQCQIIQELPTANDPATQALTAAVVAETTESPTATDDSTADPLSSNPAPTAEEASSTEAPDAVPSDPASSTGAPLPTTPDEPSTANTDPATTTSTPDAASLDRAEPDPAPAAAAASKARMVLAATTSDEGSKGDFKATSLAPSGSWSHSGSTGAFNWSYPFVLPPASAGAVTPEVALSYNSASIDGRVSNTNSQGSWVGMGWDYQPGFIERSYRTCKDAPGATTGTSSLDLCWAGPVVTMSLGGQNVSLVRDDATGQWHPSDDSGARVELLTGASNGDNDGEHWRITTTDGIQYYFGRQAGPGWTSAQPVTNSTWTVPVYGRNAGEPCHNASGFAASKCMQAWRWNLDYVEDTNRNVAMYYYATETGHYRPQGTSSNVPYVRAGNVSSIHYGMRNDSGTVYATQAPQQIQFMTGERCVGTAAACAPAQWPVTPSLWQDTPRDLHCESGTAACTNQAPTFWSSKRLAKIEASASIGGTMTVFDKWDFTHGFPIGSDPHLSLTSIVRTGYALGVGSASITLPEVRFEYELLDNRVIGYLGAGPMVMPRLIRVNSETGLNTSIVYGQPAGKRCTATTVPTDLNNNAMLCFPVNRLISYATTPTVDYFHKYVVTSITDISTAALDSTTTPDRTTSYTYVGHPGWKMDDSEITDPGYRTVNQFRGFETVEVRTGATNQTLATTSYLRGMGGTVTNGLGETISDADEFSGLSYQSKVFNGAAEVSASYSDYTVHATTGSRTRPGLSTLSSRIIVPTRAREVTALQTGGSRTATTTSTYDSLGRTITQTSSGPDIPTVCALTVYADNTTSWIRDRVAQTDTYANTCPAAPTGVPLSASRTYYDGAATLGTVPGAGNPTKVETALDAPGSVVRWARSQATYDSHGRILTSTAFTGPSDTTGRTTSTAYTPAAGGPLMSTVVTNPLGQTVQTTVSRAKGTPTQVIDESGLQTNATLDPLGRVVSVTNPGQQGTGTASTLYTYLVTKSGGSAQVAVTEQRLVNIHDSQSYVTTTNVMNSYGETVQTQTDAEGAANHRVVKATFFDEHGRAVKTHDPYYTAGAPSTSWVNVAEVDLDSRTLTSYDQANRTTRVESWSPTGITGTQHYAYGGDRVTHQPKAGGTTRTDFTDVHGNPTRVRLYTTAPTLSGNTVTGGAYRDTTYTHSPLGAMTGMTDALGATWTYSYDLAGRQTNANDPDSGASSRTYLDTGETATITDARAITLTHTYDKLGRKTATHHGATQLSSWVYDTLSPGKLTSSTRYTTAGNYVVTMKGYNEWGLPTGKVTNIPTTHLGMSGDYHTFWSWTRTGLMRSEGYPGRGGMSAETVTKGYTRLGNPKTAQGTVALVSDTTFSPFGTASRIDLGINDNRGWLNIQRDAHTQRVTTTTMSAQVAIPQIAQYQYTYNPVGDILKTVHVQGGTAAPPVETTCYRYNGLRELSAAWSANSPSVDCATTTAPTEANTTMVGGPQPFSSTWTYDAGGSRTQQVEHKVTGGRANTATTTYTMATPGRVHALTSTSTTTNPVTTTTTTGYTYDNAGNTLTRTGVAGGNQTFAYNPENRANTAVTPAGTQSYIYDADGTQLVKKTPSITVITIDGNEYVRANMTGAFSSQRYFTHAGYPISAKNSSGIVTFLHKDQNGTATSSISPTATGFTTPIRRNLDPYGKPLGTPTGTWTDRQGFLGKHQDAGTGLTELGARLYDPTTGRFTQVDPLGEPLNPQQNNGYNYGWNNPVANPDPDGMRPLADGLATPNAKGFNKYWASKGRSNTITITQLDNQPASICVQKKCGTAGEWTSSAAAASQPAVAPPSTPWWKTALAIGAGVVAGAACGASGVFTGGAAWIACGAIAGAVGSTTSSAVNGGSFTDQLAAGMDGALLGAVLGAASKFALTPKGAPAPAAAATPSSASSKVLWTTWQNYPKVTVGGREYAQVGSRLYTHHAVDRMQPRGLGAPVGATSAGRSISPNHIEDVLTSSRGVSVKGPNGEPRLSFSSGSVQVITEKGIVITVITR